MNRAIPKRAIWAAHLAYVTLPISLPHPEA
jgi:hypothetical protein